MRFLLVLLVVWSLPSFARIQSCAAELEAVSVLTLAEVRELPEWKTAFQERAKDSRYFELVEETINPEFEYRYLAVHDSKGGVLAIQPFVLLDQDILEGAGARAKAIAKKLRNVWPSFARIRVLMVGNAAGPGYLQPADPERKAAAARILAEHLVPVAKAQGARLAILKEFPRADREVLKVFEDNGFTVMSGMPHTRHDLAAYGSFADYRSSHNRNGRRRIDRHLEASKAADIELEVRDSAEGVIDEAYALYAQTLAKADMSFERLTPEYLREMGKRMPDKARFFFWRQNGRMIGMAFCMVEGDTLLTEYLGMDYEVVQDLNLYFRIQYDVIGWAIDNGFKSIVSTPLVYEPKYYLGHQLLPVDLYLAQTLSPRLNGVLKRFGPAMDPARNDLDLKRFSNYADIWPAKEN